MRRTIKILPHEVWDVVDREARPWKGSIFHHTAIESNTDQGEQVDDMHREGKRAGYPRFKHGMGYHILFNRSGSVEVGERWIMQLHGAHCRTDEVSYNYDYLGLCLTGNLEKQKPTEKQVKSFLETLRHLGFSFGAPHYIFKATLCPGKNFPLDDAYKVLTKKLITKWRKRACSVL